MGILYLTHIVKPVIFINMVTFPPKTGQNELLEQRPLFPHQNRKNSPGYQDKTIGSREEIPLLL